MTQSLQRFFVHFMAIGKSHAISDGLKVLTSDLFIDGVLDAVYISVSLACHICQHAMPLACQNMNCQKKKIDFLTTK